MAENIVAGLFGMNPQMYGEQQRRSALQEGITLAQLDPAARGAAMSYAGARGLGNAIGGAMGIEDPQLKLISARNAIAQQIDQSNPESILQGAKMLAQAGDQQGAFALAQYARQAQESMAQTQQRLAAGTASLAQAARERIPPTSKEAQYAKDVALLSGPEGSIQYNTEYAKALLEARDKPEKLISSGTDRDAISREMYDNKIYVDLTAAQKAAVNKRLEAEQGTRAEKSAPKIYAPGQQVGVKDWQSFTLDVLSKDPVMQRTTNILSDAPAALEVIRTSTSNDISAAALPGTLSRLVGKDSSISNLDIKTYASTGGLDDVLASSAVKFFTGRATDVKKDQAEKFTIALYRGALLARKKKLETAAEEFGYSTSPNYKFAIKNIDDQLAQFKLVKKGEGVPSTQKTGIPLLDKYLPQEESK